MGSNKQAADSPLTMRQAQVLRIIVDHIRRYRYPPTLKEIAATARLSSKSVVQHHLLMLERKGYIERDGNYNRAITVKWTGEDPEQCPWCGGIMEEEPWREEETA